MHLNRYENKNYFKNEMKIKIIEFLKKITNFNQVSTTTLKVATVLSKINSSTLREKKN